MSTDPKFDDLHRQLFEEGLKVRRAVVGDTYVNQALANGSSEFSRPGQELVTEWCWVCKHVQLPPVDIQICGL